MALILDTPINNTGFTGNYWRIVNIFFNFETNETVIDLVLYKDESARKEEGSDPTSEIRHIVLKEIVSDPREAVYDAIKAVEDGEFATATDN
jgi:hypothetical protein